MLTKMPGRLGDKYRSYEENRITVVYFWKNNLLGTINR